MPTYGTGMNSPPAVLVNTMNAITEKYVQPFLADVIFVPSATFWGMTRDGQKVSGGELVTPLVTQEEMTGGAYQGDQLLDTAVIDSIQPANQVWRHYRQSLAIPVTDIILNSGRGQALSIVDSKWKVATGSMLAKLCRAMYHVTPQNTTKDIDDIPAWVKTLTNTIGGINRSTAANSFWLPQANYPCLGGALNSTLADAGYITAVFGYDEPGLFLMDNARYVAFKSGFLQNIRYGDNMQDKEALQVGFRNHFLFNNAIVLPDRYVPANEAYLLNTKYIYPVFHEDDYFTVDPWVKPTNQRVIVSTVYLTWQLVCDGPRMQVAFTGIA